MLNRAANACGSTVEAANAFYAGGRWRDMPSVHSVTSQPRGVADVPHKTATDSGAACRLGVLSCCRPCLTCARRRVKRVAVGRVHGEMLPVACCVMQPVSITACCALAAAQGFPRNQCKVLCLCILTH